MDEYPLTWTSTCGALHSSALKSEMKRMDPLKGAEILRRIRQIEMEEDVVVCLAVESGSRAWGFASPDSDYDARFIFVRRPEAYLCVRPERVRDVIERPIVDGIDLNGWDVRKALDLFLRSNPPLLEWLQCGIVYLERHGLAAAMRAMMPSTFAPRACFHHYLHIADGNFRECQRGDVVTGKRYLYALRAVFAMRWIERGLGTVPIEFERLLERLPVGTSVQDAIAGLLAEKRSGAEHDGRSRDPVLDSFLDGEIRRLEGICREIPDGVADVAGVDRLFRQTLREIWGNALPE